MNRQIKESHVKTMLHCLEIFKIVIRPIIICESKDITGTLQRWVLDGQHLLQALIRLGWEIPYIIITTTNAKDLVYKLALINNTSKPWGLMDYINAYRNFDEHYSKLFKLMNKYNMERLFVASIAMNPKSASYGIAQSKVIRKGNFKMNNPRADEMCKKFYQLYITSGVTDRWVKKALYDNFIANYDTYNHDKVNKKIAKHIAAIRAFSDLDKGRDFIKNKVFN
jgi:hypothetical protein